MKSICVVIFAFIIGLVFIIQLPAQSEAEPLANGENVCNTTVTSKREKRIEEPVEYRIPYQTICDLVRTCTQYRIETRTNSRKITVWEDKIIPTCCKGYAEHSDRSCKPICTDGCRNGKCVAPNECKCDFMPTEFKPGYTGVTCSRFVCLDENKWGPSCQQDCNCSPNSYCHATTGKCICKTNWRGTNCTEPCESNKDSGCDEFTLLQLSDPEVNMIPIEDISPRSQALQLDSQSSIGANPADTSNVIQLALTQTAMNIILVFITFTLIFTLVRYRQRLNAITNELYYSATSSSDSRSSTSGDSNHTYADPSLYSEPGQRDPVAAAMQKRPLVPIPDGSANHLSKNLSFASATRNIVKGITPSSLFDLNSRHEAQQQTKENPLRGKCLLDPLVEARLARSQDKSKQNVYCKPEISISEQQQEHQKKQTQMDKINQFSNLSIQTFPSLNEPDNSLILDGHYQVPKSPSIRGSSDSTQNNLSSTSYVHDQSNVTCQYSIDIDNDENDQSNIYEEIHPRSHPGDSSQK